ncbi:uncharacterized protein LOC117247691 isoform X1 [Epinephelus lanceolatus]|uniref:uncharacterized protein LOC117247691 isoform X1 n=1 Tax=Epinephelus lanceolatus TaxID=310571 RepID=UPI001447CA2B|nr:uncharacterized protein LOC117247691 isoform X1 [Epinephelus lanceolatus]
MQDFPTLLTCLISHYQTHQPSVPDHEFCLSVSGSSLPVSVWCFPATTFQPNRKKAEAHKTGGGPLALSQNTGRPVAEGIPGGNSSSEPVTPQEPHAFIRYSDGVLLWIVMPLQLMMKSHCLLPQSGSLRGLQRVNSCETDPWPLLPCCSSLISSAATLDCSCGSSPLAFLTTPSVTPSLLPLPASGLNCFSLRTYFLTLGSAWSVPWPLNPETVCGL